MDIDVHPSSLDETSLSPDDDKENEDEQEEQDPLHEGVHPGTDGPLRWEEQHRPPAESYANTEGDTVANVDEAYRVAGTVYDSVGPSSSWTLESARSRGRRRTLPWRAVHR
ncbi:hypothetical protein BJX96DRAFT_142187 [Aspergillus floccosus]